MDIFLDRLKSYIGIGDRVEGWNNVKRDVISYLSDQYIYGLSEGGVDITKSWVIENIKRYAGKMDIVIGEEVIRVDELGELKRVIVGRLVDDVGSLDVLDRLLRLVGISGSVWDRIVGAISKYLCGIYDVVNEKLDRDLDYFGDVDELVLKLMGGNVGIVFDEEVNPFSMFDLLQYMEQMKVGGTGKELSLIIRRNLRRVRDFLLTRDIDEEIRGKLLGGNVLTGTHTDINIVTGGGYSPSTIIVNTYIADIFYDKSLFGDIRSMANAFGKVTAGKTQEDILNLLLTMDTEKVAAVNNIVLVVFPSYIPPVVVNSRRGVGYGSSVSRWGDVFGDEGEVVGLDFIFYTSNVERIYVGTYAIVYFDRYDNSLGVYLSSDKPPNRWVSGREIIPLEMYSNNYGVFLGYAGDTDIDKIIDGSGSQYEVDNSVIRASAIAEVLGQGDYGEIQREDNEEVGLEFGDEIIVYSSTWLEYDHGDGSEYAGDSGVGNVVYYIEGEEVSSIDIWSAGVSSKADIGGKTS